MNPAFCSSCNAPREDQARFCSQCGRSFTGGVRSWKGVTSAVLIGIAVWAALFPLQRALTGQIPLQSHRGNVPGHGADSYSDPVLERLRQNAAASPNDPKAWQALAERISEQVVNQPKPEPELVFGLIDALSNLLRLKPDDTQALLTMANVSFNQQAFAKAADFFRRYLALVPDDVDARSTLGSTLAFLGQHDAALAELDTVQRANPRHFQAAAYRAIIAAERGDKAKALTLGEEALAFAPHEEARTKFQAFLGSLKNGTGTPTTMAAESAGAEPAVVQFVRQNPVAGPKYESFQKREQSIEIRMRDFPMDKMPPFAKEKFLSGIRAAAARDGASLKEVVLLDAASGAVLHREALTNQ